MVGGKRGIGGVHSEGNIPCYGVLQGRDRTGRNGNEILKTFTRIEGVASLVNIELSPRGYRRHHTYWKKIMALGRRSTILRTEHLAGNT
jgi:hypothetical protein